MKKPRILIVEDSRTSAEYLEHLISSENYLVDKAEDGQTCLGFIRDYNYNLILLDLELPDYSGLELLKFIREQYSPIELPIVFISATSDDQKIIKALDLGANDFISKPFTEIKLKIKIRNLLQLQQSFIEINLNRKIQKLNIDILYFLNSQNSFEKIINFVLTAIKQQMAYDAVGIRFKNHDDFPYFAQEGFSEDFLLAENSIIAKTSNKNICKDENGNVCLECTCGSVLSKKTDTKYPFYTEKGSFWSNNTLPLLDVPLESDPRFHPRNTCIHKGYNSVALIPIKDGDNIIGLLQLNDKNTDCFTIELIHYFEGICEGIGMAFIRKQGELIIENQNAELKKLNNDKDRFMSVLAHDLKNPFQTLIGFSELLQKNLHTYNLEKIEKYVGNIHKSVHSTYNLLEDLLLWAKAQSGKLSYEPKKIMLEDFCSCILENLNQYAIIKDIRISMSISPELNVFADANMLKTILRNLITNAIKFTHNGGSINISAIKETLNTKITIADNGIGINQEVLSKLFEISEVQSTKGTNNEEGTGLGLLLCKEFIEKNNGKIWVESQVGIGSKFIFNLPNYEEN